VLLPYYISVVEVCLHASHCVSRHIMSTGARRGARHVRARESAARCVPQGGRHRRRL
jgi:hypothetical protein